MLQTLRISDFAIIDAAELHLGAGLTALTGETGAGKSILIEALALVLGGRGNDKVIRTGRDQTEIEALFEGPTPPDALLALAEAGLSDEAGPGDGGDSLILRRILTRSGRSRCYVNGHLVTQGQLRAIAAPLCDLSSQHAQHRLLDGAHQLELLDAFGGLLQGHRAVRPRYAAAWRTWQGALAAHRALQAQQQARADRLDWLRFVHEELTTLALQPGEIAATQQRLARLRAADQIVKTLAEAVRRCEDEGGLRDHAARVARSLQKLAAVDAGLARLQERAEELAALSDELSRDLAQAARQVERDERALASAAERLDVLLRAVKKHGGTETALLERQAAVARELDADATELELRDAERAVAAAAGEVQALAAELAARRRQQAPEFAARITATVRALGMPAAEVAVAVSARPDAAPGPTGGDQVALLLQANVGESAGRLAEVASGGELSRTLLAVRRATLGADLAAGTPLPIAIYDEVDAGLSGSVGLTLGAFLREVARRQQVIVISHLPQVAAAADCHVRVHKLEQTGRTHSRLEVLDAEGKVLELARMLGAAGQSRETAAEHARRLLAGQGGGAAERA